MEQQNRKFMNFEDMMQRAVNVEVKISLRSSTIVWDLDICCSRGHCLSNSTALKIQTQETTAKDSHLEEPKIKKTKPILSQAEASKLFEQAYKEKKKKKH